MNSPLIQTLADVLERGRRAGVFRGGIDPVQLYISIAGPVVLLPVEQPDAVDDLRTRSDVGQGARRAPVAHHRGGDGLRAAQLSLRANSPNGSAMAMPRRSMRSTSAFYRHQGHLTVNGVFSADEMDAVVRDIEQWGESFLSGAAAGAARAGTSTAASARARCCASSTTRTRTATRCKALARDAGLVDAGRAVHRPRRLGLLQPDLLQAARGRRAEAGAPGQLLLRARPTSRASSPRGSRSTTRRSRTAASISATAPTRGRCIAHFAPEGEPYNLQLPSAVLEKQPMAPAPVRKGGISFHHGNTFHQSGPNHSRTGAGPARCTSSATTSSSPTRPCPTTTPSSSR